MNKEDVCFFVCYWLHLQAVRGLCELGNHSTNGCEAVSQTKFINAVLIEMEKKHACLAKGEKKMLTSKD